MLAGMLLSWQMGALLQQSWQQVTLVIQPSKKVTATFVSYQHGSAASLRCCCENPFSREVPSMLVAVTAAVSAAERSVRPMYRPVYMRCDSDMLLPVALCRYSEGDKVAMNVGFYYMANAMGRLTGTLVSGALYTFAGANVVYGLGYCFVASMASAVAYTAITLLLRDNEGGLLCGSKLVFAK